ncbi:PQQ-dependent sugar dehydrogenase [Rubrivivax sp. RP6-9]|uniref:PQQ-dependent sugar dehydrogenase n=1 Tax=Rubrivivax sp. RP6-9 TaxID=3415750 RepID=UPI003CC5E418
MKTSLRLLALAAACAAALAAAPATANTLRTVEVAKGLDNPWALAFLPDGRMLVTEKPGRLRVIGPDGRPGAPITGLPPIAAGGQCGLLDVVPDPQFAQNQLLYWTFAEPGAGGNSTAVARGKLVGNALTEVRTLFSQQPKVDSQHHCGSRIVFRRDGTLLVGLGDRFSRKDDAQNPANHLGKVVAFDRDGGKAAVWSLGHRNIQGAALHPETGALWAIEHGPQGGDEVNVVAQGRNYGWPLLTYGRNYGLGTRIGEEGPKPGFEQPLHVWVPSIAPSGMAFLTSDRYPGWQGQLFVGALRGRTLVRLQLEGTKVVTEERLLLNLAERIRDVRQGPDGWLYLVTDGSNARVLRVETTR